MAGLESMIVEDKQSIQKPVDREKVWLSCNIVMFTIITNPIIIIFIDMSIIAACILFHGTSSFPGGIQSW